MSVPLVKSHELPQAITGLRAVRKQLKIKSTEGAWMLICFQRIWHFLLTSAVWQISG